MDLGLHGRRALVAAATSGLGLATAQALAKEGARVAICGRDRTRIDEAASLIGRDTVGIAADLSSPAGASAFVTEAIAALGGVDILVINAGGPAPGTFSTTRLEDYERAIALNLLSVIAMCEVAVPEMVAQHYGRIVAITSVTVRQPIANLIASTTARSGATGFLKTLATEVAPLGITVNSVQPGYHTTARVRSLVGEDLSVLTADIPTGTLGDPNDFGALVAVLCSDRAGFVTGAAIPIDGGQSGGLQ